MQCGCQPGALCPEHEAQRKRHARTRHLARIKREAQRYRDKKAANPEPCSNCEEVKPVAHVGRKLCSACLMWERRVGSPRPKPTKPFNERCEDAQRAAWIRKRGWVVTPEWLRTLRDRIAAGASRRQLAKQYGVSITMISLYARYDSVAEYRAAKKAQRHAG